MAGPTDALTRRDLDQTVFGPDESADARTRQIVQAAYDLLQQDGLEGLTIRAVLARTGLARRAFYERFGGKDDLVLAIFGHVIRLSAHYYAEQVSHLADPVERLRLVVTSLALGTRSIETFDEDRRNRHGAAMSREHLRLAEARPAALQGALSPLLSLIARLLSEGMAAGNVRAASPERLATLIYNLVSTTIHAELLAQEDMIADRARRIALADDVWEFCLRAIST
jgi:AcrR family transcriptional regulator